MFSPIISISFELARFMLKNKNKIMFVMYAYSCDNGIENKGDTAGTIIEILPGLNCGGRTHVK